MTHLGFHALLSSAVWVLPSTNFAFKGGLSWGPGGRFKVQNDQPTNQPLWVATNQQIQKKTPLKINIDTKNDHVLEKVYISI